MYWIPTVLLGITLLFAAWKTNQKILPMLGFTLLAALLSGLIVWIDFTIQTDDTEVWSGRIEDWEHKEEWEEWHPPVTTCTTDSKGNQSCTTTPGYWEHHPAENHVKTSDNGWNYVSQAPDGTAFTDSFPNNAEPLKHYFPLNTPTASTHSYTNRVQASYSIYKHPEIDLNQFPDLPSYPDEVKGYFYIDRIVGNVPHKQEALNVLSEKNAELNKMVPDPEKPGKKKSWKQVNLIFVNVGENKPETYGFALQDKWEGGNKNDFVVSFSMDSKGNIAWVYPFSWCEVEILKLEVRDYIEGLKKVDNFAPVVEHVSDMVAQKFERKSFSDFDYLHIDVSGWAYGMIWMVCAGIGFVVIRYFLFDSSSKNRKRKALYF